MHDPFLWRVFYPSVVFLNGGCQAANTMLYISPEAEVYPCPTVPVVMGNLAEMTLKEIICSDAKRKSDGSSYAPPAVAGKAENWTIARAVAGGERIPYMAHGKRLTQPADSSCYLMACHLLIIKKTMTKA